MIECVPRVNNISWVNLIILSDVIYIFYLKYWNMVLMNLDHHWFDGLWCGGLSVFQKAIPQKTITGKCKQLFLRFLVLTEDDKLSRAAYHRLPLQPVTSKHLYSNVTYSPQPDKAFPKFSTRHWPIKWFQFHHNRTQIYFQFLINTRIYSCHINGIVAV